VTPLCFAAANGYKSVVKLLLGEGADLESKDIMGRTPLSWAAENCHEKVTKLLLKKGAWNDSIEFPLFPSRNGDEGPRPESEKS
jgi:ankyrin repeat protein